MKFYHLNVFYWSQLRSSWSPDVSSGFLLRDMGLFVLPCKHPQGDSSNPGNLTESPWAFNLIILAKNWVSLSSLGHRGSENSKNIFFGLPVTGNYRLPLLHGVPISLEPYIAESFAWSQTLCRHRLPQGTWKIFAVRSSGWPELATLWPRVAKIKDPC